LGIQVIPLTLVNCLALSFLFDRTLEWSFKRSQSLRGIPMDELFEDQGTMDISQQMNDTTLVSRIHMKKLKQKGTWPEMYFCWNAKQYAMTLVDFYQGLLCDSMETKESL